MKYLAVFGWPKLCSLPCSLVWQVHKGKYLMYFDNCLIIISIHICICRRSSFPVLFWLKVLEKQKKKMLGFFFISEATKLTSMLFFGAYNSTYFLFAFLLVSVSLIQGCKVKHTLSIKILVLLPPKLEFCCLRKTKKILQLRILYDQHFFLLFKFFKYILQWHCLYLIPNFKTEHKMFNFETIDFSSK